MVRSRRRVGSCRLSALRFSDRLHVVEVVRVCEKTYEAATMGAAGITVRELEFPDGEPPADAVIEAWLDLCDSLFSASERKRRSSLSKVEAAHAAQAAAAGEAPMRANPIRGAAPLPPTARLGVHCVAGLGRAPVLVAVALIEHGPSECRRTLFFQIT